MKPLFSVNHLSFSFVKKIVFDTIDLEIYRNEVTLISGENGCGKSTFCKILYKSLCEYSGTILFEEKNFQPIDQSYISSKMIYIQEQTQNNLVGSTPDEDLAIWQHKLQKKDNEILKEERIQIFERFRLKDVFEKPLWELSTGQQKRAVLAGLLLNKHKFWILDDPLFGLDNEGVNILLSILAQQKLSGIGALIATQRPKAFSLVADKVFEIADAHVAEIIGYK